MKILLCLFMNASLCIDKHTHIKRNMCKKHKQTSVTLKLFQYLFRSAYPMVKIGNCFTLAFHKESKAHKMK